MAAAPLATWIQALSTHIPLSSQVSETHAFIDSYQAFWQNIPFWVTALIGVAIVAIQRQWWHCLVPLIVISLSYLLGSCPQISVALGFWLPIWLISFLIIMLISRFAARSQKICHYSGYFPQSWPVFVIALWALVSPTHWWSAMLSCFIAIIPQLLARRLALFQTVPAKAMRQAAELGANRQQRVEWVARRYLKAPLKSWLRDSFVLSMFSCMLAGFIGFPGIGHDFLGALTGQHYESLLPSVIALIGVQLFLASLITRSRKQEVRS